MLILLSLCLLLVVASSSQQQCDQHLINNVADFVMQQLITKYPDNIRLSNISSSLPLNTGSLEAKFGNLARISSIRRHGDLVMNIHNSVNIILDIKFLYLVVNYELYRLKVVGLSTEGSLQTTVLDNRIQIDVTMGEKSLCFLTINRVKFLELGDFEVRLNSNCKWCSKITSSVTSSALNYFKTRIKSLVEAKLNETLHKIFKPDNPVICNNLNMYFFEHNSNP